jgi:hypothetical protein
VIVGQYFYCVNPAKRQYLLPHAFGDGLKLMEFGSSGSGTMMALAVLLADSNGRGGGDLRSESPLIGSWAGDPIVITGDYADDGKHVPPEDIVAYRNSVAKDKAVRDWLKSKGQKLDDVVPNLYHVAERCYEDISDKVILALCDDPYERKALIERGAEAAKQWKPPAPKVDPFALE